MIKKLFFLQTEPLKVQSGENKKIIKSIDNWSGFQYSKN